MQCGSLGLPAEAVGGGKVNDPAAVGQALKQLVARTEITETRALVAVSDSLATFRILHVPATATDQDVTALVSKELPLDPEKLATRWLDAGDGTDHRVVYAAAWDRALVKQAADAVRLAGLEPVAVELKSACIARATTVPSCIVIDLTSDPIEIFLIDRHVPQVWHALPAHAAVADNLSQTLGPPLRSVLRFYRRQNGLDLAPSSPVLVSGEQALPAQELERLAEVAEHAVTLMPAPSRIPGNVRHATYLTCLGLLMRRS